MPMPKGHKTKNGYSTKKTLGGDSYHDISAKMTEKGFKMNHSTARNVFVNSLKKIAKDVVSLYNMDCDERDLNRIAKDPRFQDAIVSYMREIEHASK
jgi:hypothetical protein